MKCETETIKTDSETETENQPNTNPTPKPKKDSLTREQVSGFGPLRKLFLCRLREVV